MSALENALTSLARFLGTENIGYMVIGGMANAVWGEVRATLDVDATIWVEDSEIENFVSALKTHYDPLVTDPRAFIAETRVLPLQTRDGIRIDLIFGALPYEKDAIDRAVEISVADTPVKFCTAEDLILHKIISDRPRDLDDAHGIICRRRETLDLGYLDPRIQELSDALERPEIMLRWKKWKAGV